MPMRMFLPVLLLMILPGQVRAKTGLSYTISGASHRFVELRPGEFLVSEHCETNPCLALKIARRASTHGIKSEGGANPGALLCLKLDGTIVLGYDARQNELSFCKFKDGSMIANTSLYAEAIRNDLNKP